jgi:phosphoribosylamine---glycine ligase
VKVLLVGGGAREHAIARALTRSADVEVFVYSKNRNPGLAAVAAGYELGDETNPRAVAAYALRVKAEAAAIGPEAPLAAGVSDALTQAGVRVGAPSRAAAEVETSKRFMRELLAKHRVPGSLGFHYFEDAEAAKRKLKEGDLRWAIKPVGLTGGKGVKVFGDHFEDYAGGAAYIDEVVRAGAGGHGVLLEELAEGEEFTLQAFTDGTRVVPTIAVQDHKRLLPGDRGPNTGGMGSYSQADGLLPFLPRADWEEALAILRRVLAALKAEGRPYHGPIYGQFMLTHEGPRIIEINARYGDPEAMNVLHLLRSDYGDLLLRMAEGRLQDVSVDFESSASVVKYVVPEGYGTSKGRAGLPVAVDEAAIAQAGAAVYYASVDAAGPGVVKTTTSRAVAILGTGETIREANEACEDGLRHVRGDGLFVRHDIGTSELIQQRMRHMEFLSKRA